MSDVLLKKLANDEIAFESFKWWILCQDKQLDFKCTQNEFLTYFLNFVHEEINSQKKLRSNSFKCSSNKIKSNTKEQNSSKTSLNLFDKSSSSPLTSVRSLEKSFEEGSFNSNTCTPKYFKIHSNSELNGSYSSPISPLYKEQDFSTPKNRKHTVCFGDFLMKVSSKKNGTQKVTYDSSKRITPTSLNNTKTKESFKSSNSFNEFNTNEIVCKDLIKNRIYLANERLEILSRKESDNNLLLTTSTNVSLSEQKDQVEPQLHLVTFKNQLNILSSIFSLILKNNLVLNITSEIYFLISLLVIKENISDSADDSQLGIDFLNDSKELEINLKCKVTDCTNYFETVHNIVYFAVKCLETQFDVLKYYDKLTLKLLSSNKILNTFSKTFSEKLGKFSEKQHDRAIEIFESRSNVGYNLDTDTKNNFPNEISFLAFRKQRDLFYEILRIWEKNHLLPGWNFQVGLGGKIKSLFNLQSEPTNFMHFARLFKAQLLSSSKISALEDELGEEDPFPSHFPNIDPSKLNRLRNRLITRQSSTGINSRPHFIGHQEFYKEFILIASNHSFDVHLRDSLVSDIIELNSKTFNLKDLNQADTNVDDSTRKSYSVTVSHLRVLAKFLGFLECIPYTSETNNYPENMFIYHTKIREQKMPTLDVKQLLLSSIKNNSVILTVPWLVKYLSMLDYITLRLPYYMSLYETLFQIYHCYEKPSKHMDYNNAMVKFCLGWLFDLPHFPDSQYAGFCASKYAHFIRNSHTLDDIAIVDQNILYHCCPYLEEIKKMLNNSSENCRTVTVKHITPVTAVESSDQISKKRLEQQLEDSFFNGQPESVKKTVEFVSERLASACVKHMCNNIVPSFKKEASKQMKKFLDSQNQVALEMSPVQERRQKTVLRVKVTQRAQENLSLLRQKCAAELSTILSERLPITIENLLAIDALPQTKTTCISITSKMCKERLKQWINSHVTLNIFMKDFEKELQKKWNIENKKLDDKIIFALPSNGRRGHHNEQSLSGFHISEKIKNISVDILEKSKAVSEGVILNVVKESYETLTSRCDVNDVITACICNSLLDLALLLIAYRPDFMPKDDITNSFIKIWRWYSASRDDLFDDILCPKNVTLLNESCEQRRVWRNYGKFIACLVKEKIIICDDLENQCTAFFRKEWKQNIINNVCYFISEFVKCYKQNGETVTQFTMLLEFLSEFCTEVEPRP